MSTASFVCFLGAAFVAGVIVGIVGIAKFINRIYD